MPQIKICSSCENVPLIFTFAFPYSECWCPCCGNRGGFLGFGERAEETEELKKSLADWKKKTKKYLNAVSTLNCSGLLYKGKQIDREDLPEKEVIRCRKIKADYEAINFNNQ